MSVIPGIYMRKMAIRVTYKKHTLYFKHPARTSRGTLREKTSWFIRLRDTERPELNGVGECSPLPGLSPDDRSDFGEVLAGVCNRLGKTHFSLSGIPITFPSIRFGIETALQDIRKGGKQILFPSDFTEGRDSVSINGLIWMGDQPTMRKQIIRKMEEGYRVIKLKIGALIFKEELDLLKFIRKEFVSEHPEIRVDANGAFSVGEAPEKLKRLSDYEIHSIEQPIQPGQWQEMASLCASSPIPIALDEELIGPWKEAEKTKLLDTIRPQYVILKPTLLGGFQTCQQWISLAAEKGSGWWITSALESNIGLNAIAQWTYILKNPLPQGLGTGQLYTNNFDSPLYIQNGRLHFDPGKKMSLSP